MTRVTGMLLAVTLTASASQGLAAQGQSLPVVNAAPVAGQILDAGTKGPVTGPRWR